MKKVLVVDDSATIRLQVGAALRGAGFEVLEAVDGRDGAEKVDAHPDLSLVISDVNMPRMSGIEMVEAVRKEGRHSALPIVMLTTESQPALIAKARALGTRGWILKPFKAELLVATAQKLTAA